MYLKANIYYDTKFYCQDEVAQDFLLNTLTQEELETQLREIYAATDEDKNGLISADEMYTLLQEIEGLPPFDMKVS